MRNTGLSLAILLLIASFVNASDNTPRPPKHAPGVIFSGTVLSQGKVLLADDDNRWTITNPEMLKDLPDRSVVIRCRMDLEKRAIHVLSIIEPSGPHQPNLGDSAFRR